MLVGCCTVPALSEQMYAVNKCK